MFERRMWEQIRIIIIVLSDSRMATTMMDCPQLASSCQTVWLHVNIHPLCSSSYYRHQIAVYRLNLTAGSLHLLLQHC